MKKEISNGKIKKITLISLITLIIFFLIGMMIYIKTTYDQSFSRVEQQDPKYSGNLRYSDVDKYQREEIKFNSGKNILKGYIYGKENEKGIVVISHGLGFGADNYLAETIYFIDKGWKVITFDNTGTHESQGKSTIGPSQSLLDLNAALTYINNNEELNKLNIMLYGHSWGAYAVTAILDYDFDISAVASVAGFNSPMELLMEQTNSILGVASPIAYPFLYIYQNIIFGNTINVTATRGINNTNTPVIIIHGEKDEAISYNGASIIAHKDKITNPNVIYKTCSEENHNGHNNLFHSNAAIEYTEGKNLEYKQEYERYNGEVPDDIKEKYYKTVDRFQVSEVNIDFMNEINLFFEKHLKI